MSAPTILLAIDIEETLPKMRISASNDDYLYYHAMFLGGIERLDYSKHRITLLYLIFAENFCIHV